MNESTKILYPKHYDFDNDRSSHITEIGQDVDYEAEMKASIYEDVRRQEIIERWLEIAENILQQNGKIAVNDFFEAILLEEDFPVAYQILGEVIAMVSKEKDIYIDIDTELKIIKEHNIALWKMNIRR